MATGKCPKCEKVVTQAIFEAIDVRESFGTTTWKGVSYKCPSCSSVLGIQIDPIAVKTDILSGVKKLLSRA